MARLYFTLRRTGPNFRGGRIGGWPFLKMMDSPCSGADHRRRSQTNEPQFYDAQSACGRSGAGCCGSASRGRRSGCGGRSRCRGCRLGSLGSLRQHMLQNLLAGKMGGLCLLAPQEPKKEGERREAVQLGAALLQVLYLCFNLPAAIQQSALHRALRCAQGLRNVPDRHLLVVVHTDDRPLILRETVDDFADQPCCFGLVKDHIRLVLTAAVHKAFS